MYIVYIYIYIYIIHVSLSISGPIPITFVYHHIIYIYLSIYLSIYLHVYIYIYIYICRWLPRAGSVRAAEGARRHGPRLATRRAGEIVGFGSLCLNYHNHLPQHIFLPQ